VLRKSFLGIISCLLLSACASLLEDSDLKEIQTQKEFDDAIKIEKLPVEETEEEPVDGTTETPLNTTSQPKAKRARPAKGVEAPAKKTTKTPTKKTARSESAKTPAKKTAKKTAKKLGSKPTKGAKASLVTSKARFKTQSSRSKPKKKVPAMEDSEGFDGRRPIVDPLRVGEKLTYKVSYFAVEAGKFDLSVKPFAQVNGRKAYHFHYRLKTSSLFSMFYAVDDVAETFVDYELWRPISYEIHVKESKQLKESKSYFDWKKMRGFLFDKKKVPGQSVENLKREWDILQWSQNVFSAPFYLRAFTLKVGKTMKVRVGHEGKNLIMSAKVLRKEVLDTPVGRFNTFVVRPTFEIDGIFKPTGDNLLWITNDDRKFILRIESKIKIGKIVSMIEKMKKN